MRVHPTALLRRSPRPSHLPAGGTAPPGPGGQSLPPAAADRRPPNRRRCVATPPPQVVCDAVHLGPGRWLSKGSKVTAVEQSHGGPGISFSPARLPTERAGQVTRRPPRTMGPKAASAASLSPAARVWTNIGDSESPGNLKEAGEGEAVDVPVRGAATAPSQPDGHTGTCVGGMCVGRVGGGGGVGWGS